MRNRIRRQPLAALICLIFAALLLCCGSAPQIHSQVYHESISLRPGDLDARGLAFITLQTLIEPAAVDRVNRLPEPLA